VPGTEYLIDTDRCVGRFDARRQPADSTIKATNTVLIPRMTDDRSRIGAFEVSASYHGGTVQRNGERDTVN